MRAIASMMHDVMRYKISSLPISFTWPRGKLKRNYNHTHTTHTHTHTHTYIYIYIYIYKHKILIHHSPKIWKHNSPNIWMQSSPNIWMHSPPNIWMQNSPNLWIYSSPKISKSQIYIFLFRTISGRTIYFHLLSFRRCESLLDSFRE